MIDIAIVGDIMLGRGVGKFLTTHKKHSIITDPVIKILEQAKITIGNLENPIALNAEPYKKGAFKAHPDSLNQVKLFNLFTIANNHVYDCGIEGLNETTEFLKTKSFNYLGVSISQNGEVIPLIQVVNGKKIAFFAGAVPACIRDAKEGQLNVIDATSQEFINAISEHTFQNDYTIVMVHGGNEMIPYPEPSFRKICQKLIDSGANIVITTHPHVLGGYEEYHDGIIFYSIGDFIFDADSYLRRDSSILKISLSETIRWEYIPVIIRENFQVELAEEKEKDRILSKINEVTNSLKVKDYDMLYPYYYKSSLRLFQLDRIKYTINNKGFFHMLGFILKKTVLIPHYTQKILFKQYK